MERSSRVTEGRRRAASSSFRCSGRTPLGPGPESAAKCAPARTFDCGLDSAGGAGSNSAATAPDGRELVGSSF
eukprot:8619751-Alexandrium_andersonii.AAC.1